jgi:DNA polymerase III epsilon subunit-like protein
MYPFGIKPDQVLNKLSIKFLQTEIILRPEIRHCTCRASRRLFKALPDHQLHTVSAHCGYELKNQHNALADAEACAGIAQMVF